MEEKKNIPQIRFKGFTEKWEEHKLFDIASYRNGKAHENDIDKEGKYVVVNSKFVSTNGKIRKFSNKQNEPLLENEIAFVLSDVPNGRALARTFIVDKSNKYTLNQRIAGITPNKDINPYYLYILMNRNKYFLQFDDGVKQTNLSMEDMEEFKEYYPKKNEQDKIGEIFKKIDSTITLYQNKHNKLTNFKEALLQKMFPKNGKNIPEIRFKEFTKAWEQRTFEEIFNYERPDKYIVKCDKYNENNKIPVLTANKAFILGYTDETNTYESESIIFDDFTLDSKFVDFPYMVKSSAIKILTLKNRNTDNLRFNYELLNSTKFEVLGHARHYISVVQAKEVYTTNKAEQNKIALILAKIDKLIKLYENKIEKLENIKKSLLEKMFI